MKEDERDIKKVSVTILNWLYWLQTVRGTWMRTIWWQSISISFLIFIDGYNLVIFKWLWFLENKPKVVRVRRLPRWRYWEENPPAMGRKSGVPSSVGKSPLESYDAGLEGYSPRGLQRVRHDWAHILCKKFKTIFFFHKYNKWHVPYFLIWRWNSPLANIQSFLINTLRQKEKPVNRNRRRAEFWIEVWQTSALWTCAWEKRSNSHELCFKRRGYFLADHPKLAAKEQTSNIMRS